MKPNCPYAASGLYRFRAQIAIAKICGALQTPNIAFNACVFVGAKEKARQFHAAHRLPPPAWMVEHWQAWELRNAIRWIDDQRNADFSQAVQIKLLEARNALTGALAIYMRGPIQPAMHFIVLPAFVSLSERIKRRRPTARHRRQHYA